MLCPLSSEVSILHDLRTFVRTKKLILVCQWSLNCRLYSNFTTFSTNVLFLFQDPVQNISLQRHCTHISFTLKSLMLFSHGPSWPVASKFLEGSSIFSLATAHPVSTLGHLHPAAPLKLLLLSSPGPQAWRLTFLWVEWNQGRPKSMDAFILLLFLLFGFHLDVKNEPVLVP